MTQRLLLTITRPSIRYNYYVAAFFICYASSIVSSCPLKASSPCHCGIRNDSTSYIDCSQQNLMDIPDFLHSFSFDQLILSDNFISTIKESSFANLRVRQIFFAGNPISTVSPAAFGQQILLNHLESVYVQFLKSVQQIPDNLLCRANKLKVLDAEGLKMGSNPTLKLCSNMTRLKKLRLSDCGIAGSLEFQHVPALNDLDLSKNELTKLPQGLPRGLVILNVSHNSLESIEGLPTSLQVLDLGYNRLKQWPTRAICNIRELHSLNLDANGIDNFPSTLPKGCTQRIYVRHLSLRSNQLTGAVERQRSIAVEGLFSGLTTIDLSDNRIRDFDASSLGDIEILKLARNELSTVPLNLPISLRVLDLSNNKICSISTSSVNVLSRLKIYILDNNPFFCDCNIQALQTDIERREANMHSNNIKCNLPRASQNMKLSSVQLRCVHSVPDCVKRAHGPHLQQLPKNTMVNESPVKKSIDEVGFGITNVHIRYLHNVQNTILVIWDWINPMSKSQDMGYVFRVSFDPHLRPSMLNRQSSDNEKLPAIQISSNLPSNARRFALQNALPDHVYTVCVISDPLRSNNPTSPRDEGYSSIITRKRCTDIYTGYNADPESSDLEIVKQESSNSSMNFIISLIQLLSFFAEQRRMQVESHTDTLSHMGVGMRFRSLGDSKLLIILICIVVLVTIALSVVLALLVALVVRRRHELRRWRLRNKRNHKLFLSSMESNESYHQFLNGGFASPPSYCTNYPTGSAYCCCNNLSPHYPAPFLSSRTGESNGSTAFIRHEHTPAFPARAPVRTRPERMSRYCCCCGSSTNSGCSGHPKDNCDDPSANKEQSGTLHFYQEIVEIPAASADTSCNKIRQKSNSDQKLIQ